MHHAQHGRAQPRARCCCCCCCEAYCQNTATNGTRWTVLIIQRNDAVIEIASTYYTYTSLERRIYRPRRGAAEPHAGTASLIGGSRGATRVSDACDSHCLTSREPTERPADQEQDHFISDLMMISAITDQQYSTPGRPARTAS